MLVTWFAAGAAAVSIVIRKRTWRVQGERGASITVLSLGLAAILLSEYNGLGPIIWQATGYGYLDDFAGHLLWMVGFIALLHQALYRLVDSDEQRQIFDALVRWPVTLIVPLMLSAMYASTAMHSDAPIAGSVANAPNVGPWLWFYRIIWYGGMIYLSGVLIRVLRIVRNTGGGPQRIARMYLLAAWLTLAALVVRVVSWWDALAVLGHIPPLARSAATVVIATAAAASWLKKLRGYRSLLRGTRTSRRARRRDTLESHRLRVLLSAGAILDDAQAPREPDPPPPHQPLPAT
ncbi:membrane protein [Mycobacterium phage PhelpsODU]|uniref:Membrane protein n=1 Tax=Mycobacterium phage Unicorn TaxID=2015825 RepID=A0A222ZKY5_9CAUD|nr:membrane protein [Mycobacterium phage Unicorn]ASR85055.1 membrane protein [Mycobacterium phage Unicorn]ASR85155.1 membrane protein [Mycobacterium phage PhelpsODU]